MKLVKAIHPYQDINSIKGANQCFSWWLVHCFLYYRFDNPIISDKDFDKLTSWVKMSWNMIDHIHKHLVTLEDLNANSGYAINYPKMVEGSAMHVLREIKQNPSLQKPIAKHIKEASQKHTKKTNKIFDEYDSLFT